MKRLYKVWLVVFLTCIVLVRPAIGQNADSDGKRMEWWREARFGMFIHFGVYSQWAGVYHGHNQARGGAEWILNRCKIPVAEYRERAREFNPIKYDADAWVKMAKDAGMKYIVITAKHHDGFALFDTKASNWDVVEATAYKKDLLKPLAEACRKYGIKFGIYYSQAQDWVNAGGSVARKLMKEGWPNPDSTKINAYTAAHGGHWDPIQETKTFAQYINDVSVPQVKELLTNYGDIAILWWDTPVGMTDDAAQKLNNLLKMQPQIITNDRLKRPNFMGNTKTPEQKIPDRSELDGKNWEACMTMNGSWGYNSWDNNWKSAKELVRNLINTSSKGGNYLINVGPMPSGAFPHESKDRLKKMGEWMALNSEAIYGSQPNPLQEMPWGRITSKENETGTILYLSVFDWPTNGRLEIENISHEVISASLLASNKPLTVSKNKTGPIIKVPKEMPDTAATVIKVQLKGKLTPIDYKNGKMKSGALD